MASSETKTAEDLVVEESMSSEYEEPNKLPQLVGTSEGTSKIDEFQLQNDTDVTDCSESVLDTMDNCVGCVEGVEVQQDFEDRLGSHSLVELSFPPSPHQSLSTAEAALIRLQIMEKQTTTQDAFSSIQDIDLLNMCGSDDDLCLSSLVPGRTASPKDGSLLSSADGETDQLRCAVCLDEAKRLPFVELPCCGHTVEAIKTSPICAACMLVLTDPTSNGASRVGRCPRCRSWIEVTTPISADEKELKISAVSIAGKCQSCFQIKNQLVDDCNAVCDACFLGRRQPLLYECEQCHVRQRIPHPMYRYQPSPNQFGNVTWACQGSCGNFTLWRIQADQIPYISVGDTPEGWGDNYLVMARSRVQEARLQLAKSETNNNGCTLL